MDRKFNYAKYFALYAGSEYEIWEKLIGCKVTHKGLGVGIIKEVTKDNYIIRTKILFDDYRKEDKLKRFNNTSFIEEYFIGIDVPFCNFDGLEEFIEIEIEKDEMKAIEEQKKLLEQKKIIKEQKHLEESLKEQKKKEEKSLEEFNFLKTKYGVLTSDFISLASPLHMILIKLESSEEMEKLDIKWLSENGLHSIIAIAYEKKYKISNEIWDLIKSCSNWRKAGKPEIAIKLLKNQSTNDKKIMSAINTTRGAAYRDIDQIEEAIIYARRSIEYNESSYQPYNLLGAIYYQKGLPEEGDEYFSIAMSLGSSMAFLDNEIKNSLKKAGEDERARVIKYLINKDPTKYKWAEYYI